MPILLRFVIIFFVAWFSLNNCAIPAWAEDPSAEALQLYEQGDHDQAAQKLKEALESDPNNPKLRYNLGTILYDQGSYDMAEKELDKALAGTTPQLQNQVSYNLGNTHYKQGRIVEEDIRAEAIRRYRNALDHYRFTLQKDPNDLDAAFNYELTERRLNELMDEPPQDPPPQSDSSQQPPNPPPPDSGSDNDKSDSDQDDNQSDGSGGQGEQPESPDGGGDNEDSKPQDQNSSGSDGGEGESEGSPTPRTLQPRGTNPQERKLSADEARNILDALPDQEQRGRPEGWVGLIGGDDVERDW